ncbi:MAG: FAD-binding protein [Cyanobacteria bacterium J06626_6]
MTLKQTKTNLQTASAVATRIKTSTKPNGIHTRQHHELPLKSAVGLYQFSPAAIAQPATEADLIQIVRYAAQQQLRVRATGAMHSAVPLPATEGLCVALDRYQNVLQVTGNLVTVQSGIRLHILNDYLAQKGLALPILGTIALQTVTGAISTGTHGGSLYHASLSSYVESMRIIRADGSVVTVHRNDQVFAGAAIALGALGLISTITFRCIPAFSLCTSVHRMPMTALLTRFDDIHRQNQYVDLRYSPITDQAHAALINPSTVPLTSNGGWETTTTPHWQQRITDRTNKLAQRLFLTHRFNRLQRWGIQRYDRHIYAPAYGRSDFVLTHFDATSTELLANDARENLDPVADMEVAVPYKKAVTALATLRDYFGRSQRFPCMHIHIRTQAAEPFWLSPTRGQPICWLEFWEYPRTGKFFADMLRLLRPFDPVGHWGKQLPGPPQQQYPHWEDFVALKQDWDREGRFSNAYLEKAVFGNSFDNPGIDHSA